ncbi:hypothetical protein [Sporosarcina ureilytica]|uniref:Uncharacterized protein n=1 Tax=Sporosarcina ureilytica TaxID=298596 RepID=A0A1D8JDG8_9BACL|nr:hypothetical protein [Sporosarcina ureilytica]AOV06723.1 hypothetical protein BI350_03350 [Sporosarcina ureilytica]
MKKYLVPWRIFLSVVTLALYFFNVISGATLLSLAIGVLVFVMLPEIIIKTWKKSHNKIEE